MSKSNQGAKRGYAISHGTGRSADDRVEELEFKDAAPAKVGDELPPSERRAEISADRARKIGLTAAETTPPRTTGENVTNDDLAPETLLHQKQEAALPNDQALEISDIDDIGAGFGLDEAELARKEHPDADERQRVKSKR